MRRDRRAAVLIAAVAATVAAAAIGVPAAHEGLLPTAGDLIAGWVLLAGAVCVVSRPRSCILLGLAAVLWVGAGLSPYLGALGETAARASLLPTALLVVAVLSLPRELPDTALGRSCAAVALAAAVIGGLGYPRGMLLLMGAALLAAQTAVRHPAARLVGVATGLGLTLVGLWGAREGTVDPATLVNLHDLTVAVGTIGTVAVLLGVGRYPRRTGPREGSVDLGRVLGDLLGERRLVVVFPHGERWLDPRGRQTVRPADAREVRVDGSVVAWWHPAPAVTTSSRPTVERLLVAAGHGARLRADLDAGAVDIAASRDRIAGAVAEARRRVADELESGPVSRLRHARELALARAPALEGRFDEAARLVDALVTGLDPVEAAGGLRPALAKLCDDAGAELHFTATDAVGRDLARTVWFTCAEGLTNAAKHAPGARVWVLVADGPCLEVHDEGPGGADPTGAGLRGLRARATSTGAILTLDSTTRGTTLVVRRPPDTGLRVVDDVMAPMPATPSGSTVDA